MKTRGISIILYVISALMVLFGAIFLINQLYNLERYRERKSYKLNDLNYAFLDGRYEELIEYVALNKSLGLNEDEDKDMQDYYIFADWYLKLFDYDVYSKAGESEKALEAESKMKELESQFTHQIFKEKSSQMKELYGIQ